MHNVDLDVWIYFIASTGVVLGGGGARGAAHVGIIYALIENK